MIDAVTPGPLTLFVRPVQLHFDTGSCDNRSEHVQCHQRIASRKIATVVWAIDRDTVREFPEGYAEYRKWEQRDERSPSEDRSSTDDARGARELERETRKAAQREITRQARR